MEKNENKSFQSSQHLLARELTHRLKGKWKEDEFQASGKFSLDPSEPSRKGDVPATVFGQSSKALVVRVGTKLQH